MATRSPEVRGKRKWVLFPWIFAAIQILYLALFAVRIGEPEDICVDLEYVDALQCQLAIRLSDTLVGPDVVLILFIWIASNILLSLLTYLVMRDR
jgi:hypothetical protein